jgi:predicted ATPase
MEPGPGLQKLLTQILNQDPALQLESERVQQLRTRKDNLPLQLTSFVGREDEVREIRRLVGAHRLVTLTGPGGVGKTRLALEAASSFGGAYPAGAWLVELGSLADPTLVPQAIATALGIHEQLRRSVLETLIDALRSRELLIVLDNCEHVVESAAVITETVLQNCAAVRVLATSREPLRVAGEAIWPFANTRANSSNPHEKVSVSAGGMQNTC